MSNKFIIHDARSFEFDGFYIKLTEEMVRINPQFEVGIKKIVVSYNWNIITRIPVTENDNVDNIQGIIAKFTYAMQCGWDRDKFNEVDLKNFLLWIKIVFGFKLKSGLPYDEDKDETIYHFHRIYDPNQNQGISVSLTSPENGMRYLGLKQTSNASIQPGIPGSQIFFIERFFTVSESFNVGDETQLDYFIKMFKKLNG